jgi:hypothetical protein
MLRLKHSVHDNTAEVIPVCSHSQMKIVTSMCLTKVHPVIVRPHSECEHTVDFLDPLTKVGSTAYQACSDYSETFNSDDILIEDHSDWGFPTSCFVPATMPVFHTGSLQIHHLLSNFTSGVATRDLIDAEVTRITDKTELFPIGIGATLLLNEGLH